MENWEFLLQKQGDKSWLPLESPTVEILEGQYRLASRTKFADVLVGIQLRYVPSPESIHKPSTSAQTHYQDLQDQETCQFQILAFPPQHQ